MAEELHFGRAARRLHVSQPPLSQTIRALEARLGVQLFERTRRHVGLTHAGAALLERARCLLRDAEHAAVAAQRASRGEIGRLTVAFILAATHQVVPATLREFRGRAPEVELTLREMPIREQLAALEEGAIDIGFLRPPVDNAVIAASTLLREPFVVALAEEHALAQTRSITLARLAGERFVMFTSGRSPVRTQIFSACAGAGFTPDVVQEAAHIVTVLGLVRAGLGVALVPSSAQSLRPAGVALRSLRGMNARAETAIAWRRADLSPAGITFIAAARAAAKQAFRLRA